MFIAVILENFIEEEEDLSLAGITDKDLKRFQKAWCKFAPYGELTINVKFLPELLNRIDAPLGFKGQYLSSGQILNIIHALKIKEEKLCISFPDLL